MSLELSDVSVGPVGGTPLFSPISVVVEPGQVGTLMGPSGIGKSTLLDAIGGHLVHGFAVSGGVSLNGRDVLDLPAEARRIGVLFQDAMLFPHLSVGDNLAFGLARHIRGPARRDAVAEALAQAGLAGFADRDPATLSGGQRARAALMRALLAEPQALLLDEPFSRLDASLRAEIRGFVFDHLRARAIPGLMVTHDASDAEAAGGIIVQL
ncbi:ATP-binding cassette domain-containing protein [Pseudorhodobacter turbinis]|uniref:ATP-binding cassette domain-containing protein n=1 Tax=Pseudorhodobacter turbinis TaxID=2500533 RepID=A0A4V1E0U9_9RHOB|nr:ATP-binding cassette domain-containing protein [Pseudorhodobacter turbinis]QCO55894.1 ATP-binding cassette domain-containing protein [Pseudorhodobacter turbinis]